MSATCIIEGDNESDDEQELLFEYFATVSHIPESLNSPSESHRPHEVTNWMPVIVDRFPLVDREVQLPDQLATFCLPSNEQPIPARHAGKYPPRFLPIVLTDEKSQRLYGSCLLRYIVGTESYNEHLLMPHVSCLLSKVPAFELGRELLIQIYLLTSHDPNKHTAPAGTPPAPPTALANGAKYRNRYWGFRSIAKRSGADTPPSPPNVTPPATPHETDRQSLSQPPTRARSSSKSPRFFGPSFTHSSVDKDATDVEHLKHKESSGYFDSSSLGIAVSPDEPVSAPLERFLVNFVQELPLPVPGNEIHLVGVGNRSVNWRFGPTSSPLPYVDDAAFCILFQLFSAEDVVGMVECLLAEKKTIVIADDVSVLTPICEALLSLLWPFRWQHIYIPVLPSDMSEYLDAPVPFLMGVSTDLLASIEHDPYLEDTMQIQVNVGTLTFPKDWLQSPSTAAEGELVSKSQFPEPHRSMLIETMELEYLSQFEQYLGAFQHTTGSFMFASSTRSQLQNPLALQPTRERLNNRPNYLLGQVQPRASRLRSADADVVSGGGGSSSSDGIQRRLSQDDPPGAWVDFVRLGFLDLWCQLLTAYKAYMRPGQLPEIDQSLLKRRGSALAVMQSRSSSMVLNGTSGELELPMQPQELRHGFEAESFLEESPGVYVHFLESLVGTQLFLNFIEDTCDSIQTGEVHEDLEFFDRIKSVKGFGEMKLLVVRSATPWPVIETHRVNTSHIPVNTPGTRFTYSTFPRLDPFMAIKPRDAHTFALCQSSLKEEISRADASPPVPSQAKIARRSSMRREGTLAGNFSRNRSISAGKRSSLSESSRPSSAESEDFGATKPPGRGRLTLSRTGKNLPTLSALGKTMFAFGGPLERLSSANMAEEEDLQDALDFANQSQKFERG